MRFVLVNYGTRGDVEPFVAVGQELLRRGHDVRMAVPNDSLGFVESAGLAAVAYGPEPLQFGDLPLQVPEDCSEPGRIRGQVGHDERRAAWPRKRSDSWNGFFTTAHRRRGGISHTTESLIAS